MIPLVRSSPKLLERVPGRRLIPAALVLCCLPAGAPADPLSPQASGDYFGAAITSIGDLDGDGVTDLAVGAPRYTSRFADQGAVWILFLNADGTVRDNRILTAGVSGVPEEAQGLFGQALCRVADLDGDGRDELAVGAPSWGVQRGASLGAVWILFLEPDGRVRANSMIRNVSGEESLYQFGTAVAGLTDVDSDGIPDLAVGSNAEAVSILFLRADGSVRAHHEIPASLFLGETSDPNPGFGLSLADLGRIPAGSPESGPALAVGAPYMNEESGEVWVLHLTPDGGVERRVTIHSPEAGGGREFGMALAHMAPVSPGGPPRGYLAVGEPRGQDPASGAAGRVWLGAVRNDGAVAWTSSFGPAAMDQGVVYGEFGSFLGGLEDMNGDGVPDLGAGAPGAFSWSPNPIDGLAWILHLDGAGKVAGYARIRDRNTPFPDCRVHVTSPMGGAVWPTGGLVTVTWTRDDFCEPTAKILFHVPLGPDLALAESVPNSGQFTVEIPDVLTGDQYRISVVANGSYDESDPFTVVSCRRVKLFPVADAFVGCCDDSFPDPDEDYSESNFLLLGTDGPVRFEDYLRFDPSPIPSWSRIVHARFEPQVLEPFDAGEWSVRIALPESPWEEGRLTWNTAPAAGFDLGTQLMGTYFGPFLDLGEAFRMWRSGSVPNYGIHLSSDDPGRILYFSREAPRYETGVWVFYALPAEMESVITFPPIPKGNTAEGRVRVDNNGFTPLTIASTRIEGDGYRIQTPNPSGNWILPPLESGFMSVYFHPVLPGAHPGRIVLLGGTGDTLGVSRLEGDAGELSLQWLYGDIYPDRITPPAQDVRLQLITDVYADSMVLTYREGGGRTRSTRMTRTDPQESGPTLRYVGVIPDSAVTARGLEFFATVFNKDAQHTDPDSGHPVAFQVVIPDLVFPGATPPGAYSLISFPADVRESVVGALGEDLAGQEWRLFAFEPTSGHYLEFPFEDDAISRPIPGRAYWLITRRAVTLDTAPARTLSTPLDGPVTLELEPGWNLIADPYLFPVSWAQALERNAGAITPTDVEGPVRWDPDAGSYAWDVSQLMPFEGYWVRNLATSPVSLAIPAEEAPPRTSPPFAGASSEEGWSVRISATSGTARDNDNRAGVGPDASDVWDRADRSDPPLSPGPGLSVYFPHEDWPHAPGAYAYDLRAEQPFGPHPEGRRWALDVVKNFESPGGDPVTLAFTIPAGFPGDRDVVLWDRESRLITDLRRQGRFTFRMGRRDRVDSRGARFALIVGTPAFVADQLRDDDVPVVTRLLPNSPNPFHESTEIAFDIADETTADLRIFDGRGRLIRDLRSGSAHPGRYRVRWFGEDDAGRRVAPGIYFARLAAGDTRRTMKLQLLP